VLLFCYVDVNSLFVDFQASPSGIVLFSGATDWDEVGRKTAALPRSKNTIWSPKRLAALADVKVTNSHNIISD
jgi:hypothetical protein